MNLKQSIKIPYSPKHCKLVDGMVVLKNVENIRMREDGILQYDYKEFSHDYTDPFPMQFDATRDILENYDEYKEIEKGYSKYNPFMVVRREKIPKRKVKKKGIVIVQPKIIEGTDNTWTFNINRLHFMDNDYNKPDEDMGIVKRDIKGAYLVRLNMFVNEFIRNGGKSAEAAMKVFKIKDKAKASAIGSRYLRDAPHLPQITRSIMEIKGYPFEKMLEIATNNMENNPKTAIAWWDRLMKMMDYADFISTPASHKQPGVNVNVFQTHKNISSGYIEEGEVVSK